MGGILLDQTNPIPMALSFLQPWLRKQLVSEMKGPENQEPEDTELWVLY